MSTEPKTAPKPQKRITTTQLAAMKTSGQRITMVTAYDVLFARLADRAEVDAILVGDSLGMVVQGDENTLGVTVDDIIYHTRAVVRGATRAHVVADMPFMSYQADPIEAIRNAGRLLKEGGAQSIKLEGGEEIAPIVERMVRAGIPVMGHVGLTPQSVHALGGFRVQGQDATNAGRILKDAKALEAAGCFAIVLEGIPVELARMITRSLSIPTIGIGAGPECDGQVLVIYDLLGMYDERVPKFVKQYAQIGDAITAAVASYKEEVTTGAFPTDAHSYHAKEQLFRPREIVPAPLDIDDDDDVGGLYGVPV